MNMVIMIRSRGGREPQATMRTLPRAGLSTGTAIYNHAMPTVDFPEGMFCGILV
jgi:hypothetical protein